MKTYIYNSGRSQLAAQDGQGWKLNFTGFKITNAVDFVFDPAVNTLPPTVTYTGDEAQMAYVPMSPDIHIVQCIVDRDQGQWDIGSIQLLVKNQSTDNIPFCVTIAPNAFTKLMNVGNSAVGTRYVFQLMLNIPQLTDRFSFVNLKPNVASFKTVADETVPPHYAWEEPYDQLIIDRHSKTGTLVPVLNAWGSYWGCPLAADYNSDNMFWKISGGVAGDDHRYNDAP